jgi:hypothetical protein
MSNIPLGITPEHTTARLALGPSIGGWLAGSRADDDGHRAPAWTNTGASVVREHECYQIRIGQSSGLRGVRGARHTRVVHIDEQPATAGLDPRLAVPLHQRAHPSVLVDLYLVDIIVDHDDVAFLINPVRDLPRQFLACRIVLETDWSGTPAPPPCPLS